MPREGQPVGFAIHATAVAVGDHALLILGPSGSGKSRLASALMGRSTSAQPIMLVGDDRILLEADGLGVVARPHPRIAGFIERRGLGLCATPYREKARVAALICLGPATATHSLLANFPAFKGVILLKARASCDDILAWFGRSCGHATSRHAGHRSA